MEGRGIMNSIVTAHKMKFSITDFFSKFDKIHRKLRIWSHLLEKSIMENFIFCAVCIDWDCTRMVLLTLENLRA